MTFGIVVFLAPLEKEVSVRDARKSKHFYLDTFGRGSCLTSKGEVGKCTTFKECYPYFKIPDLGALDGWVLGVYDTCSYVREDGRMSFGICCSNYILNSTPTPVIDTDEPSTSGPIIEDVEVMFRSLILKQ